MELWLLQAESVEKFPVDFKKSYFSKLSLNNDDKKIPHFNKVERQHFFIWTHICILAFFGGKFYLCIGLVVIENGSF